MNEAKYNIAKSVNTTMVQAYWSIGRYIVEFEQGGAFKAKYGDALLTKLSKDLKLRLGKGYSRPNLNNMRKFYRYYPNCQNISDNLSWSHFCELIKLDDELERNFYEKQIENENWNIKTLKRQVIGIILMRNKDELLVEYATYEMDNHLFVSKYELYLPNREELKRLVDRIFGE